jgi:hypothetical protein
MEEERADRPVEAPPSLPSPPAAPEPKPRSLSQGEEEAAFEMANLAKEALKLVLRHQKRAKAASKDIEEIERKEQEDEGEDEWGFIRHSLRASARKKLVEKMTPNF